MNFYRIKSKRPNCISCGKPLEQWDPFSTYYEHIECSSKRIVFHIMDGVKQDLKHLIKKIDSTMCTKHQIQNKRQFLQDFKEYLLLKNDNISFNDYDIDCFIQGMQDMVKEDS